MKTVTLRTIGILTGAFGLKGDLTMKPVDADAPWSDTLKRVFLFFPTGPQEADVTYLRHQGDHLVIRLNTVSTREVAEKMTGIPVKVPEDELPALADDEFYIDELLGLTVVSADSGDVLGEVIEVLSADAGEFLDIKAPNLTETVLVPFRNEFVTDVRKAERQVLLTGLDSLFTPPPVHTL